MRFASIDIGSNAVRLMLCRVLNNGKPFFSKDSLVRMAIRLGEDSFTNQLISEEKKEQLISTMIGFKHLIKAYKPISLIACATAAMREARNAPAIIQEIREKSGIDVKIISGRVEAETLYLNHIEDYLTPDNSYLYIDVGGGSTEMTLFSHGQVIASESFNIGSVRIISNGVSAGQWAAMKSWTKQNVGKQKSVRAIGSGGNINKLYKFAGKKEQTYLSYNKVKKIYSYLNSFSLEERVRNLRLHTDRADVILPATNIFLRIMKWGGIDKIYVPQFGLADGLIRILYQNTIEEQNLRECLQSGRVKTNVLRPLCRLDRFR